MVRALLDTLAKKLNSAKAIDPNLGFQMLLTFIQKPTKGGRPAKKNPGRRPFDQMHKKCVIKIKHRTELYCARAIVTMREWILKQEKQKNSYESILKN